MKAPTLKQFNFAADLVTEIYDSSDTWHYFMKYYGYNSKGQARKQGTVKEWSQFIEDMLNKNKE